MKNITRTDQTADRIQQNYGARPNKKAKKQTNITATTRTKSIPATEEGVERYLVVTNATCADQNKKGSTTNQISTTTTTTPFVDRTTKGTT